MSKFLIIGLGSMGKRRVRCLKTLGYDSDIIIGFDLRLDRREESEQKYGIKTIDNLNTVNYKEIRAVIVSLPPDKHFLGVKLAINNQKPVFIEASVVLEDVINIQNYNKRNIFVAPSCTLFFHPLVKKIKEIVKSGKYGKITNFSYHSGQYLPDWHPWENVKDFYVSNRITGGAREIVPFELSWITDIIGIPQEIKGVFSKTINCEADIEDSYAFTMKYKNIIGAIIIDVASRYAIRNFVINLEEAQIQWRWDESKIRLYEAKSKSWIEYAQPIFKSVAGYNENINENMYVEEITAFLKGIEDRSKYPNTIENDIKILQLLKDIEDSDGGFDR